MLLSLRLREQWSLNYRFGNTRHIKYILFKKLRRSNDVFLSYGTCGSVKFPKSDGCCNGRLSYDVNLLLRPFFGSFPISTLANSWRVARACWRSVLTSRFNKRPVPIALIIFLRLNIKDVSCL